jgi:pimeloyl-ACP methyl ester carboxylesterase
MSSSRRVTSGDGTTLAVFATGDPDRPTVIAVHGYPDNHMVWDGVVAILAARFHVVTYDVRGSGESDKPRERAAYRMERLVDDLAAVLEAVSPERPVHLLAHDWGSMQSWPAVTDPRFAHRIASFTSISGPSLDYAAHWVRRHPGGGARQAMRSYYMALFQLPVLPEAAWRSGAIDALTRLIDRVGRSAVASAAAHHRTEADKINGLALYRANLLRRLSRPDPRHTDVPVQIIAPRHDLFATVALAIQAPAPFVSNLHTRTVAGGHWVVSDRPDVIARCTSEFVEHVEGRIELNRERLVRPPRIVREPRVRRRDARAAAAGAAPFSCSR